MSPTLSPEQKAAVAAWLAAGDNLSAVQKKLREQFAVALTYMDVRFLVDDLNLQIKDPPKPPEKKADLAAAPGSPARPGPADAPAAKKSLLDKAKEKLGLAKDAPAEADELAEEDFADEPATLPPGGASNVSVTVDNVTLTPGAIASGGVTFSDGVTGQWVVDQYGRPGFTKVSQPGYRPSAADAQAFMQELSRALQKKGF
jgi:hypothetical protein